MIEPKLFSALSMLCAFSWAGIAHGAGAAIPAQPVSVACASEATASSCGTPSNGISLGKCIQAYKKAHATFKLTPGCSSSIQAAMTAHDKGKTDPALAAHGQGQ